MLSPKYLSTVGAMSMMDGSFRFIRLLETSTPAVVAKSYPLREIVQAQRDFVGKAFTGKLVLIVGEDG